MAHTTVSPDGRWAAYASNEGGGNPQIYVQSLTGVPGRWQISTQIGIWPRWTQGGRELVYETGTELVAVEIDTRDGFHPGTPRALFALPVPGDAYTRYWATEDGRRFFLLTAPRVQQTSVIEVVTDFASLVNRR
jgi:hypothetical protein